MNKQEGITLTEIMEKHGVRLIDLSRRFGIPYRSLQNWASSGNAHKLCPPYVLHMMDELLERDER